MILALLAALGAIVVGFVLYPVFTAAPAGGLSHLDESELALSDLYEKKAMLYGAIQDLDFEKAAGKVSEEDYQTARGDYLTQVAAVIEKIDALEPSKTKASPSKKSETAPSQKESKQRSAEKPKAGLECSSCDRSNPEGAKFCIECGKPLAVTCAACGESLPSKARFCSACGEKVSA